MKSVPLVPFALLLLLVPVAVAAPLPLGTAANASRVDGQAADGKGGWLDLGSNDLHVLPAGTATYGGIPFVVPPCADERTAACLVLGRTGEQSVVLPAAAPQGGRLYLLHAVQGGSAPERREVVARVNFRYADGSSSGCNLRKGRDVEDWTSGKAYENCVRGWTAYNDHTQVSLFVSSFPLEPGKTLKEIEFKATGHCPWMVVAATTDVSKPVKGLKKSVAQLGAKFKSPPERTKRLLRGTAGRRPRNVILVIGDGMGPGTVRCASLHQHGRENALAMQQCPIAGLCITRSADHAATDSAAAATAIATGTKTSNGVLGMAVASKADRQHPRPLVSTAAKAHAAGVAVGLVSNDRITGATPAAFYAGVPGRGAADRVAEQAVTCGYEVLVGASGSAMPFTPVSAGGGRRDGRDLVAEMTRGGYACVTSQQAFAAAPREARILGFFLDESQPETSVAAALQTTLGRLGDSPKGFFVMCESGLPDHGNHGNDPVRAVKGTMQVDWAASVALDFAEARDDTLVLVTADHETGGVSVVASPDGGKVTVHYSATSHTPLPVAIFAYGPGAECFEGLIDNTDIAKILQRLLGL